MSSILNVERIRAEDLFVTPEIKESPWARGIFEGLELMVTTDEMIPGHFGTYFGAVARRTYTNWGENCPYIDARIVQDLYHLHECKHLRTFGGDVSEAEESLKPPVHRTPPDTYMNWVRRMVDSETEASLDSECNAYIWITDLRKKTFKHEIWIDRFMRDGNLCQSEPGKRMIAASIRKRRLEALNAPRNNDYIEHQVENYGSQNIQWCRIWAEPVGYGRYADETAFRVVERHMAQPDWMDRHQEWLHDVSAPDDKGRPTPFLNQALHFYPIYKHTTEYYGNHVLMR